MHGKECSSVYRDSRSTHITKNRNSGIFFRAPLCGSHRRLREIFGRICFSREARVDNRANFDVAENLSRHSASHGYCFLAAIFQGGAEVLTVVQDRGKGQPDRPWITISTCGGSAAASGWTCWAASRQVGAETRLAEPKKAQT